MCPLTPKNISLTTPLGEDLNLETNLRPKKFDEYIGQEKVKENIKILIQAAQKRKEKAIDHLLIYGPAGLGKTTLAYLINLEFNVPIKITSGPALEKPGDMASILTNLAPGEILFIDECHRISRVIEEILYTAMEEFKLDLIIGKGPSARTLRIDLPPFTLIGATTRPSLLSNPLRTRFGATFRLNYYQNEDLEKIIQRSAHILNINIEKPAISLIAKCSRGTPRVANRLLKRVRDFAQVKNEGKITFEVAQQALKAYEIDEYGLEIGDRELLKIIITKFNGGPVGLKTLAAATGEEEQTIEEIYEPYLMQLGLLIRTPKGREASQIAFKHLNLPLLKNKLFY